VIVMADRFQVVKNAQDGSPKPMLRVENGKTVLNGELIADGGITARKMAADSISAAALQAGAVRANHVAAGELTADKLAIGLGGNLLYNPIFANQGYGWRDANAKGGDWNGCPNTTAIERTYHQNDYHPKGEVNEAWRLIKISGTQAQFNTLAERRSWVDVCRQFVNVVANKWYIASVYVGGFHCARQLIVEKYHHDEGEYQGAIAMTAIAGQGDVHNRPSDFIVAPTGEFAKGLGQNAKRLFVKFKAPDTGKILLVIWVNHYAKNQTYADFYVARPMLEECTEHTREPSPWQNAGVTAIHGGSIVTKTVTTEQLAADSVTANEIAAGVIGARHVATKSLNANHIATRSLTAELLNVSNLAAISANLGRVTAGTITGT
ncbi:phage tail tip fiber protein, partial [Rodentibacter genomosp. 1]|uniref:phage tail tip fiber protein n=1 Tax=Rodentibacter genomosp. 1 TaxID=1908264 RepID=UPI003D76823E